MRNPCLDEGILQSYTDGELEPQMLEQVVSHLATCAACSEAASLVESEMEFATAAFAHEMNMSVPTERLRARLDEAIAGLHTQPAVVGQSAGSRLGQWFASFVPSFNFAPQRALGFASLAVFFVLATIIGGIVMRERNSQTGFVAVNVNQNEQGDLNFIGPKIEKETPIVETGAQPVVKRKAVAKVRPGAADVNQATVAENTRSQVLPGERNYLQAISVLSDAIEANGESSLKPTLLADYKRNLAVVDQAITATQRTARTNPKSTDAAEMLYAAYQSKLDLLSAVAEQSRPLVAQR
jgi:Predicted transmembrane transcriptional regulator (anti-sigma factor)